MSRPGIATRHPSIVDDSEIEDFSVHALRPAEFIEDDIRPHSVNQRGRPRRVPELPPMDDDEELLHFDMPVLRDNGELRMLVDGLRLRVEDIRGYCFDTFSKWSKYNANINNAAGGLFYILETGGWFSLVAHMMGYDEDRLRRDVMQQFPEEKINELMRTKPYLALVAEQERVAG